MLVIRRPIPIRHIRGPVIKLLPLAFLFRCAGCCDATGVAKDKPPCFVRRNAVTEKPRAGEGAPAPATTRGDHQSASYGTRLAAAQADADQGDERRRSRGLDKDFNTEDWVVNPKNNGIRDVVVWLAGTFGGGPADLKAERRSSPSPRLISIPISRSPRSHRSRSINPAAVSFRTSLLSAGQTCYQE
jgi:hypothetical protein